MSATVAPARFVWRAGPDRVGHATWSPGRNRLTTACGVQPVLERWAHPVTRKCRSCLEALGLLWLEDPEP